jgi:pimeloyl-ACP methyl ester carboxylesterase
MPYTLPSSIKPFTLDILNEDYAKFMQLLELSRIGPRTYEASEQNKPKFGITHEWITKTKDYWLHEYDWRAQEKHINSFPNYTVEIEGLTIHFVALFSEKIDAVPITLLHGWPGSFIEFLPMASLLREKYLPKDLPYHIIIPSVPGYTLSSGGPLDKEWRVPDSARVLHTLMLELGFERYIAHGGDVGSFLATTMAVSYEQCVALHLNFFPSFSIPEEGSNGEELSDFEKKVVERAKLWAREGNGYAIEHGTRPATIAFAINSNPLSLLAWIGEKFLEWSDQTPSLDEILTNVSLYWFTNSFPRSIYPYQASFNKSAEPLPDFPYVVKPLGFSWFMAEIIPGFQSAIAKQGNLVFHRKHVKGGHFAAIERPMDMLQDIEDFTHLVWQA